MSKSKEEPLASIAEVPPDNPDAGKNTITSPKNFRETLLGLARNAIGRTKAGDQIALVIANALKDCRVDLPFPQLYGGKCAALYHASRERGLFITAPAKPEPGDIVMIERAHTQTYRLGVVLSAEPGKYTVAVSWLFTDNENTVKELTTDAGLHGLDWNPQWSVRGFVRI